MNATNPDVGPFFLIVLLIGAIVWLIVRMRTAESRPEKIGYAAAACGIGGFVPALFAPEIKKPEQAPFLAAAGILTLLLAVIAIVLAIWTFRARRTVRRGAPLYPVIAMTCGAANLFCGFGIVLTGSGALAPTEGTAWTWRSDQHGFEVTIPSELWTNNPNPNVLAYFTCPRPHTMAIVAEVRPASTDAEFESALAFGKGMNAKVPVSNPEERSGQNRHGHPYWMLIGEVKNETKPYVTGVSITHVKDKAVVMMYEGQYRLSTDMGRAQESRAFRTAANEFLGSVR